MVNKKQSFTIKLEPDSVRIIEQIAELVCDQLFINDTYYGSILIALTEMFSVLLKEQKSESFEIEYNTDYQVLTLSFHPVSEKVAEKIKFQLDVQEIPETEEDISVFLIISLVDDIEVADDTTVHFSFNIGALHNEVYQDRVHQLNKYFNLNQKIKASRSNGTL